MLKEAELRGESDGYVARYALLTAQIYENLADKTYLPLIYTRGWSEFFQSKETDLFLFAAVTVLAAAVALHDKTGGFYAILSVTKRGRRQTRTAKLLTVTFGSFLLTLLFSLGAFGLCGALFGYSDPRAAIQSLDEFRFYR